MADYSFSLKITGPEGFSLDFNVPIGITRIGRQPGNDIVLSHSLVSRGHALIETTGTDCHLTDLGSSNGTTVNGAKLAPNAPIEIKNGDAVRIGAFDIAVISVEQVRPEKDVTPEKAAPPPVDASIVEAVAPAPPDEPPAKPKKEAPEKKKQAAESKPVAEKKPAAPKEKKETAEEAPPPPPPPPPPPQADPAQSNGHVTGIPSLTIHSSRLLPYLPGIYHTDFMSRFLGIFEATELPIEWTVGNFDMFLSAGTAPEEFLSWLAGWYGITFDSTWSESKRRTLLEEAHAIYARRGTAWALSRILEIYTGEKPEIDDQDKKLDPFTFRVTLAMNKQDVDRGLIEALIEAHKPAHTSYTLTFKR